jgi:hypothetical protein
MAFLACKAALVRPLIMRASSRASEARMCNSKSFAWGMSQAFTPGFHKIGDEGEVATEPIELGYDEGGFAPSTKGKCFIAAWASIVFPGFDFCELAGELVVTAIEPATARRWAAQSTSCFSVETR